MFAPVENRVSLVVTGTSRFPWNPSQVVMVDSLPLINPALSTFDIERIILDRSATADEYLHLLATLPPEHAGDVLLVREDGGAFLSSISRGGDRVLYALKRPDVDFYIETHGLTADAEAFALIA